MYGCNVSVWLQATTGSEGEQGGGEGDQEGEGEGEGRGGGEEPWSLSQESISGWASEEMELEHIQALYRCSTDDDKIREEPPSVSVF